MRDIDLKNIRLKDGFWSPFQDKVIDMVIPYQEKILRDQIADAEKSHAIANFRIAAGLEQGEFYGMVFQDSDVAKWIEGAAYSLIIRPDAELEKRIDAIIDIIEQAQQPDGYLDTYFIVKEPDRKWTNLLEGHELYCAGHMIEAGVAYYEATGKDKLLAVCRRLADHIDNVFRLGGREGIPGHQEIELALVKLYKATGEERYIKLAQHFIDQRGTNRDFFKREKESRDFEVFGMDPDNLDYNQSYAPVREQTKAVGHSVRAMYMYEAMADLAAVTGDESLLTACKTLWSDVTEKKMYVTGGIGSDGSLESFSKAYYLPNDMAYNETCAQIAMMFFTKKLLDANKKPEGKYADVMELLIYNSTISGMQFDGTRFFYVNPLETNPGISGEIFGHKHVIPSRPRWYACACCPPNLVRMITSLGKYALSEDGSNVYSHMMIGSESKLAACDLTIESKYPWTGYAKYTVRKKADDLTLAIHLPGYVHEYKVLRNGADATADTRLDAGYLYFEDFSDEETIELSFDIVVRRVYANDLVLDDAMKVAFKRGPICYCFEGVDNGEKLQKISAAEGGSITELAGADLLKDMQISDMSTVTTESLKDTVCLQIEGMRTSVNLAAGEALYTENRPSRKPAQLIAVPYYLWGNRGLSQMRVWINE